MSAVCNKFHRAAVLSFGFFSVNSFPTAADGQEAVAEADHSQQCHDTEELTAADSHQLAGQSSQLEEEGREKGRGDEKREREREREREKKKKKRERERKAQ